MVKKNYSNGTLLNTVYSWSDLYETKVLAAGGAAESTSYYFVNNGLIAKKNNDGTIYFYHNDHLGSTNILTESTGTIVESTKYDPWGEVSNGGTKSKFLYTGQEKDSETGLNYYNFRYYDSHIRRFTQPDDVIQNIYSPQTLNRYSYANNNPLRYSDPTGHSAIPGLWISDILTPKKNNTTQSIGGFTSVLSSASQKITTSKTTLPQSSNNNYCNNSISINRNSSNSSVSSTNTNIITHQVINGAARAVSGFSEASIGVIFIMATPETLTFSSYAGVVLFSHGGYEFSAGAAEFGKGIQGKELSVPSPGRTIVSAYTSDPYIQGAADVTDLLLFNTLSGGAVPQKYLNTYRVFQGSGNMGQSVNLFSPIIYPKMVH